MNQKAVGVMQAKEARDCWQPLEDETNILGFSPRASRAGMALLILDFMLLILEPENQLLLVLSHELLKLY